MLVIMCASAYSRRSFKGKQEESDVYIETLKAIEHPISKQAVVLATICSYAGEYT